MTNLLEQKCKSHGVTAMNEQEIKDHLAQLSAWREEAGAIEKTFRFQGWLETVAFVDALAWICHVEDHHPELHVTFDHCTVRFSTHSVGAISYNDFICAAKADGLVAFTAWRRKGESSPATAGTTSSKPPMARGGFAIRGRKSDCVVGDLVAWQPSGDEGVIDAILPRRNLFYRQDAFRSKAFAANVDQLLVVVAAEPVFSESQLARALIAARAAGIPARIALNKKDLPAFAEAQARLAPYIEMGVDVIGLTLKFDAAAARDALRALFDGRVSLILGPSGAGKSSLVNLMVHDAGAQVGEISQALRAGRHTTTSTQWYWIDDTRRSALIDSPGFQEFGLQHLEPNQLAGLMPDLARHADACRFYNCLHVHEPGCGVTAALARGDIAASRYRIYLEILGELQR